MRICLLDYCIQVIYCVLGKFVIIGFKATARCLGKRVEGFGVRCSWTHFECLSFGFI